MKRASAIKVVLSCTGLAEKKKPIPILYFSSEIGNFNVGGPVKTRTLKINENKLASILL
jgi:hypothetical protein